MIAAVMIVTSTASVITGVPNVFKLLEGSRLLFVHLFHQVGVHLHAISHAFRFNLQRFIEKIIATGDEINEVADAPWSVRFPVKVDMDATSIVREATSFTQVPDDFLQGSDILLIGKDGTDQFTRVFPACGYDPRSLPAPTADAAVVHDFPVSTVRGGDDICVVVVIST